MNYLNKNKSINKNKLQVDKKIKSHDCCMGYYIDHKYLIKILNQLKTA